MRTEAENKSRKIEFPSEINLRKFLSAESHDLKTPFNHVIGFSRIVLRGQDGPLTDFQKEDLNTVYNSGMRALGYMNALVEMARIGNGEKETTFEDVDIRKAVIDAVATWKKGNPARKLELQHTFACTAPTFRLDEMQIRQVIFSLMSMVAEYVEGGTLIVRAKEEENSLLITVQSVGNKAPNPGKLELQMHGYVANVYIDQHRGKIITSEETDEGALIVFQLPKDPEA